MSAHGPRFLIVRLGALGDIVHGIPVAAALRARYPDARIDWMVDPRYVELLGLVRCVDRKIALNPRSNRAAMVETIRELRRRRYYATFDLQGLLKSAVLARLSGARRTIGFSKAHLREPMARFFYTMKVDPPAGGHVIHKNLSLLSAINLETRAIDFPIAVRRTPVVGLIEDVFGEAPYVVLNMGAAWPNKRWPPDRFGALAAALRDRYGLRSLVLWGPGEEKMAAAVVAASNGAATLAPGTTITDVLAIVSAARLMISGDTGPLHVAAAVGTPCVGIFGPTSPQRNGPWSPADLAVSRFDRCACAYERRCTAPSRCLDTISVDDVVAAAGRRVGAE